MKTLEERLDLIAAQMTLREPFIGAVYTKLDRQIVTHGTAATNGVYVKFAREFCDPLTDNELFGLALHEAMHVILMHPWRREGRHPVKWNIANDAFINKTILSMTDKNYKLPEGGVDIDWVTTDMSSEEIYAKLSDDDIDQNSGGGDGDPDDGDEDGDGAGGTSGGDGDPDDGDSAGGTSGGGGWDSTGDLEDAPDGDATQADMEASILTAAKMAKAAGDGSKLIDIVLSGELEPTVSWEDTLRHVMNSATRNDYSFAHVNKRYVASGLYMPSLHSQSIGGMVVGIDTSGSMSQEELNQIASEVNAIFEDCRPDWVEVVYCDTQVKGTQRFYEGDVVELEAKGRGGTAFAPVFEHVQQLGEPIAAMVYFTDLYGSLDLEVPEYPVIWGVTGGSRQRDVPFGEVVSVHV
jgi:predicted metal-dependent peptidase